VSGLRLPGGLAIEDLAFDKAAGLLPVVVQDSTDGRVLMVGYADRTALRATLDTGLATFHSRSRGTRWVKGETSGNTLRVVDVEVDCDRDTVLLHCEPSGPTCHTGSVSCFDAVDEAPAQSARPADSGPERAAGTAADGSFLADLDALVTQRHTERPAGSYTTSLFESGTRRIAQKVGEEGVETALAAVVQDDEALLGEAADLTYHLLVLLRSRGLGLAEVEALLRERHR
jgi:phosphoribosyl-ATP pyrophosphohydrolase/phosphoribosyl-AMP cyclohydrolase